MIQALSTLLFLRSKSAIDVMAERNADKQDGQFSSSVCLANNKAGNVVSFFQVDIIQSTFDNCIDKGVQDKMEFSYKYYKKPLF